MTYQNAVGKHPAPRKSRKGGVRVSLVHAKPLSAPVTGQQREQSSHRTPKTLITALHSLPTVFYPNLLPSPPHIFRHSSSQTGLSSCTASLRPRPPAPRGPLLRTITCKCHGCLLPLIKVVAAQFRTSDVQSQRLPKDIRDETEE